MTTTRPTSPATDAVGIEPGAVAQLRKGFRGALLRPGEDGYDEARRVWNGAVDRRPGLIARCAGADDVTEAVRFARRHDLTISVRGGGHSIAGLSVCDDGLMIDLALMKAIRVDELVVERRGPGRTLPEALAIVRQYGATHSNVQIAKMLNDAGLRTGKNLHGSAQTEAACPARRAQRIGAGVRQ